MCAVDENRARRVFEACFPITYFNMIRRSWTKNRGGMAFSGNYCS